MKINARVERLIRLAAKLPRGKNGAHKGPPPDPAEDRRFRAWTGLVWEPWAARCRPVEERFWRLVGAAEEFVPEDEADALNEAVDALWGGPKHGYEGSPWWWENEIFGHGWSALPGGLTPEVVCQLLRVRLLERGRMALIGEACEGCGLGLPHRPGPPGPANRYFPRCPHCGGRSMIYAHYVPDQDYPWKSLPGYVGPRPHFLDKDHPSAWQPPPDWRPADP